MSARTYLLYAISATIVLLATFASARPANCGGDTTDGKRRNPIALRRTYTLACVALGHDDQCWL